MTQYIYNTRPQFNNFKFLSFIKSQFTTNAQNVIRLVQCTHGHIWPLRMVWQTLKCFGEVSIYFQLQMNTLGCLRVPTDKNLEDWDQVNVRVVPRTLFVSIYVHINFICSYKLYSFSLFWCTKLNLVACPSVLLDIPCIGPPVVKNTSHTLQIIF
jgi:hypothetical protein